MRKKLIMFSAMLIAVFALPLGVKAAPDAGWHYDSNGWWYVDEYGEYPSDEIRYIHGEKYLFDENGYMQKGWHVINGRTFYFDDNGVMANSGWQKIGDDYYYFYEDGRPEKAWGVDGYYVDEEGRLDSTPGWRYNPEYDVWHYIDSNGRLVSDCWKYIDGKYYYFYEAGGVMAQGCTIDQCFLNSSGAWDKRPGWKSIKSGYDIMWYYVKDDGYVVSEDWYEIDGEFYYFNHDGSMAVYRVINGCYVNGSGVYDTDPGWKCNKYNDTWFYVNEDYKAMFDEWALIDGKNYHFDNWNGIMDRSTVIDGYYLSSSGAVNTNPGWKYNENIQEWFYVKPDGTAAYNEWIESDGNYYYFYDHGVMASDYGADGYFVGSLGARDIKPGWKHVGSSAEDCWYYVKKDGKLTADEWKKIDGKHYYFYTNGVMASDCVKDGYFISGSGAVDTNPGWKNVTFSEENNMQYLDWYYVDDSGEAVCEDWRKIGKYYYYFNELGLMEKDSVIDGYYVDENGIWRQ